MVDPQVVPEISEWSYFVRMSRKLGPFTKSVEVPGLTGVAFPSLKRAMVQVYDRYTVLSEQTFQDPPATLRGIVCTFKPKNFLLYGEVLAVRIRQI